MENRIVKREKCESLIDTINGFEVFHVEIDCIKCNKRRIVRLVVRESAIPRWRGECDACDEAEFEAEMLRGNNDENRDEEQAGFTLD